MPQKKSINKTNWLLKKHYILFGIVAIFFILLVLFYNTAYNSTVVYKGITPCADCPGIEETITLYNNKTYSDKNVYLEKSTSYTDKGTWNTIQGTKSNPTAKVFQLIREDGKSKSFFILKGNQITPLDVNLNELPPPYNSPLTKQ